VFSCLCGKFFLVFNRTIVTAGYDYSDVVKSTCLLSDMANFSEMNEIYGSYYTENPHLPEQLMALSGFPSVP
jgi:enamine deaminase RidA (YjgF/YER057c/UK114 family)